MTSQIYAFIGLLVILGSLFLNVLAGTQVALFGVGLILLGIFVEVRKFNNQ
jgi:hypothetical protein